MILGTVRKIGSGRRRFAVALMVTMMALVIAGMTATGAGAASMQEGTACSVSPAVQGESGAASGGGGQSAVAGEEGQTGGAAGGAQTCDVGAAPGTSVAAAGGSTCTIAMPQGLAPGASIIVTLPLVSGAGSAGTTVAPCLVQIVEPANPGTFGAGGTSSAGGSATGGATGAASNAAGSSSTEAAVAQSCVIVDPGSTQDFTVVSPAGGNDQLPAEQAVVVQEIQPGDAQSLPAVCGFVVPDPAAADTGAQGGGQPQGGVITCTVGGTASGGTGAAGTAGANEQEIFVAESGQVVSCPAAGSGSGQPAQP